MFFFFHIIKTHKSKKLTRNSFQKETHKEKRSIIFHSFLNTFKTKNKGRREKEKKKKKKEEKKKEIKKERKRERCRNL